MPDASSHMELSPVSNLKFNATGYELDERGSSSISLLRESTTRKELPPYDKSLSIRNLCIAGIVFSYISAIVCVAYAIQISKRDLGSHNEEQQFGRWQKIVSLSPASRIVLDFVLNAAVTICTESLGYIHSNSLRWALWRRGQLQYCSNLRLLTNVPGSIVNSWYTNLISTVTLVITYAAASQVLLGVGALDTRQVIDIPPGPYADVNGIALLCLGLGLLVQTLVAHACLWRQSTGILTWSSSPLTVSLAGLHDGSNIQRREGRCMIPALQSPDAHVGPVHPCTPQPSLQATDRYTRYISRFVSILMVVTLIWGVIIAIEVKKYQPGIDNYGINSGPKFINLWGPGSLPFFWALLFIGTFQAFATLALHSVELLVNRSRDEACWRAAALKPAQSKLSRQETTVGASKSYNSFTAALTSWQAVGLFVLKPLIHWLFGKSFAVNSLSSRWETISCGMNPWYIFGLSASLFVLATFAVILAGRCPKGYIPTCWGHLQTIVDLIDDWGTGDVQKLYWGDKGQNHDGSRHAGTSTDVRQLGLIRPECLYSGVT